MSKLAELLEAQCTVSSYDEGFPGQHAGQMISASREFCRSPFDLDSVGSVCIARTPRIIECLVSLKFVFSQAWLSFWSIIVAGQVGFSMSSESGGRDSYDPYETPRPRCSRQTLRGKQPKPCCTQTVCKFQSGIREPMHGAP